MKNDKKKNVTVTEKAKAEELLSKYKAQTEKDDDIHFEHYDWTYNDTSCCC